MRNKGVARNVPKKSRRTFIAKNRAPDQVVELSQIFSFVAFSRIKFYVVTCRPKFAFRKRLL